jgi:hypothetical protein
MEIKLNKYFYSLFTFLFKNKLSIEIQRMTIVNFIKEKKNFFLKFVVRI